MRIRNLYPGSWGSNCYLLISGQHAAVVDPSAPADDILHALREEGAQVEYILLTHGHFDHVVSLDTLRQKAGIPALIHEADADMPSDAHKNAFFTCFGMERRYGNPDKTFRGGDLLRLGEETIEIIHTPGHTAGCVCFLCNREFLLTGDTLFANDRGRTDVYSSDEGQIMESLERLRQLPQDLVIYPGHGRPAALGDALDSVLG